MAAARANARLRSKKAANGAGREDDGWDGGGLGEGEPTPGGGDDGGEEGSDAGGCGTCDRVRGQAFIHACACMRRPRCAGRC